MIETLPEPLVWILVLSVYMTYGLTLWYPFRHDGVGFLPGFAGIIFGGLVTFALHVKVGNPALTFGFPFALAGVSLVLFHNKKKPESEQAVGGDNSPAPRG